jgi:hypothetical protein
MKVESKDKESQFQNPKASKLEDETNEGGTERNQVNRLAEKLAQKSSKVEKDADGNRPIFSK